MYSRPIQVQPFNGGFSATKFNPMSRLGAGRFPVSSTILPGSYGFPQNMPAVMVPQGESVFFTQEDDGGKTILTIAAAIGLLALGATLF